MPVLKPFKAVLSRFRYVGIYLYHKAIKTAYGAFLGHYIRFTPIARRARHILQRSTAAHVTGCERSKNQKRPAQKLSGSLFFSLLVSLPASKSGKSGKLKVARKSKVGKVAKVAKVAKVESRLRVATVRELLDSRRVGEIPLANVICTIVGVIVDVRCNHVFGLILIAKVVFAEENA